MVSRATRVSLTHERHAKSDQRRKCVSGSKLSNVEVDTQVVLVNGIKIFVLLISLAYIAHLLGWFN